MVGHTDRVVCSVNNFTDRLANITTDKDTARKPAGKTQTVCQTDRQTDRDKDRDRGTTIETNRRTFKPTTVSQKCLTSASSVGE